jgi:hypothetical protein
MPRAIIFAAALLAGSAASSAQTPSAARPAKNFRLVTHPRFAALVDVSVVRPQIVDPRSNIAICTNFATSRALGAKAMGVSYAAQNRVLDMAFVLCMAGPSIPD